MYIYVCYRRLSQERIEEIIGEAVKIEKSFVCDALPVSLIGMNAGMMSQYIEFVADRLIDALGHKKIYNSMFIYLIYIYQMCCAQEYAVCPSGTY